MVLRHGDAAIATLGLLAACPVCAGQGITVDQAKDRVRALLPIAARGLSNRALSVPDATHWVLDADAERSTSWIARRRIRFSIDYGWGASVSKATGRVMSMWLPEDESLPQRFERSRALTANRYLEACNRYYRAAGFDLPLKWVQWQRDFTSAHLGPPTDPPTDTEFRFEAVPTFNGVPYHHHFSAMFVLEDSTARLVGMSILMEDVFSPPASVVPAMSLEGARALMLEYLAAHKGLVRTCETSPVELQIWAPFARGDVGAFTDEDLRKRERKEALLAYRGYFCDADTYMPGYLTDLPFYRGFEVIVDAQEGRVKSVIPMGTGFGGSSNVSKLAPFRWDMGSGPLSVLSSEGKVLFSGIGDVTFVKHTVAKPWTGTKVVIRSGAHSILAEYDRATGRLLTRSQGRYCIGELSSEVARRLESPLGKTLR